MILSTTCWILLGAAAAGAPARQTVDLYVSPQGRDAWSGRLPAPGQDRSDGPLATMTRAVETARRIRKTLPPDGVVRVVVRPGTYYLKRTLTLTPADSRLTILGENDRAVLSGGRVVRGWKPFRGKILQADLSTLDLADLSFRELYCDGRRQPPARVPNLDPRRPRHGGFLFVAGAVEPGSRTKLRYRPGELDPARWSHPERALVVWWPRMFYENVWTKVKRIDPKNRVLEVERGIREVRGGERYYVCNLLEELDAPGEWYCAPDTKTLYFQPPPGANPETMTVTVPALKSLVIMHGATGAGPPVTGVRLQRLALQDCRGNAVELVGATNCTVAACAIRNVGVGVRLGDRTHDCRVVGCDITQTLQDGVALWGTAGKHERVSGHLIDNNYIWDFGYGDYHNRVSGVWMVGCSHCRVTHNHIHDGPRYAIGMDVGNDNEIAFNKCHHLNLETADTGIIEAATAWHWSLPQDRELAANRKYNRGNSIHHNLVYDSGGYGPSPTSGVMQYPYYSWGIYLDLHCSFWHVHHNVVYNTVLGGFMLNAGLGNVVENNVFVNGQQAQIQWNPWPRYEFHGNLCRRNVFDYQGRSALLYRLSRFKDEYVAFEHNLIHSADGMIRIVGVSGLPRTHSWPAWTRRGHDSGSVVADPLFVDRAGHDYRFRPGSPAFELGIDSPDLAAVGNYAGPERRTWPRPEEKVVRDPAGYDAPARPRPSQPRRRTYEDYAGGETERNAHVGTEGAATVLVTDETAAGGNHALEFTDAAGLKHDYVPYVTYPLEQAEGILRAGFDLCWTKPARFVYEWRDDPYVYNLGPQLSVDAQGRMRANQTPVMTLTTGRWVRVDIVCPLGDKNTGVYRLTLRPADGEANVWPAVHHDPRFKRLNCVVVMSPATRPTRFFLDNVTFEPVAGR